MKYMNITQAARVVSLNEATCPILKWRLIDMLQVYLHTSISCHLQVNA